MRYEDIDELDRYEYTKECPCCSLVVTILTQRDYRPEYYTGVYVLCGCGEYVEFVLPVN